MFQGIFKGVKKIGFNIFDIGVLLVILLIIAAFFWIRASREDLWIDVKLVVSNDDWWWEGSPPQWWFAEGLKVGDKAKNTFGKEIGEITDIINFDVGEYRRRIFVDLKLKGSFDKRRGVYLFSYQPIQVGKPLDLNFGKYNLRGIVTYVEIADFENFYKDKVIEVEVSSIPSWLVDSYREGLEMKDSRGRVLAKVLSVSKKPSKAIEVVEIVSQKEIKYPGNLFYDAYLKMQIKTFESNGVDYFVDRAAIKVGNIICFQFRDTLVANAKIIKIIQ